MPSDQESASDEDDPDGAGPESIAITEALDLAKQFHRSGDLDLAGLLYYRILEAEPETAEALHFAGLLQHQKGQSDEALGLLRRSIEINPELTGWHSNLGNVLFERGQPGEAVEVFDRAIALDPGNADAHNNRAVALRILDRPQEAEASYRRAIAANPKHQDAYDNLGRLIASDGRIREAIFFHAKARELDPHNERTRRFLVAAYAACGERASALAILDEWLAEDPGSGVARHLRASVSGEDVPERASDDYVETVFDRFASSFDVQLAKLGYRAPALAAEAVAKACGEPHGDLAICDAGCGTGLCGPLLLPYKAHLTGVDLSERMLDKARARRCYDDLVKAELTAFLLGRSGRFDLIVSADTLCYFGALPPVLQAAAHALRDGGWMVFSVEAETGPDPFRLNPHGRYSHRADHVSTALASAGLELVEIRSDTLRKEAGDTVAGLLVTARRLASREPTSDALSVAD